MMNKCQICQKEKSSLLPLVVRADDGDYHVSICDTCWDIIATVALRAVAATTQERAQK